VIPALFNNEEAVMKIKMVIMLAVILAVVFCFISSCTQLNPSHRYQSLLEGYIEAWNTGNVENLERIVSSDFEFRMTTKYEARVGLDSLKAEIGRYRTAYPDFHIEVHEIFYSENAAAIRWTITATNSGPGWNPPTGKQVDVMGMSLLHFEEGKIKDEWVAGNNLLWWRQLGFTLVPPEWETETEEIP
jgi:steroid delta-isomerase-like uncharacterized protein